MTDPSMDIPNSHWEDPDRFKHFIPGWTEHLRAAIQKQPDPARRFEEWLSKLPDCSGRDPRLTFIEQPYLDWARLVRAAIFTYGEELRRDIAERIAGNEW